MTAKCTECNREVYKAESKCVLHCKKGIYSGTSRDWLSKSRKFYLAILDFTIEKFLENISDGISIDQLLAFPDKDTEIKFIAGYEICNGSKDYLKKNLFQGSSNRIKIKNTFFDGIHFPEVDNKSLQNYRRILSVIEGLEFRDCFFYGANLSIADGEVFFDGCVFKNTWCLEDYKTLPSYPNVVYAACHFKKKIEFLTSEKNTKITLSKVQFDDNCRFDNGINLKNVKIKANIFSVTNHPENSSSLSGFGAMKGLFEFTDCTFSTDQEIFLANAEEASFSLKRCTFDKKFKIRSLEYGEGYGYQQENKAALKSLTFNSCKVANNEHSYLRIGFLKDCKFWLKNLKNQQSSELNIGDCHFSSFELTNFRNLGKFKLFKINIWEEEVGSKFKIDNTSIGNTDFQSLDLTSFSKVFMFDNIFSEVDYTNVQWPKTVDVEQLQKEDNSEIVKKRDTYRTLKNVALKNNDRPQALTFYAKEMENHYEVTKWNPTFGDKLTLWFNQFTNQFGMSWARPLVYLVVSSLLLYACLYFSLLNNSSGYLMLPPWENYWTFLNPMHKVEFMFPKYWNGWTYFIDLLFRVIQALLIYQTIQAFRKFTRPL